MPVTRITDPADPRLDDYRDLRDAGRRRDRGLFAVEGRWLVERLLAGTRFRPRSVLATPAALAALADAVARAGVPAYVAKHATIRAVVGFPFHRAALALGERGAPTALADVLAPAGPRTLVVLEGATDPENVGGVFRSALAFGVDGVVLAPGTADPLNRKALRVSAGAALRLPFAEAGAWPHDLARLRAAGYTLLALTPHREAAAIDTLAVTPPARLALLVGTEGAGLSPAARSAADLAARIPIRADVDSLNLVVATGIALHRLRGGAG